MRSVNLNRYPDADYNPNDMGKSEPNHYDSDGHEWWEEPEAEQFDPSEIIF